MAALESDRSHLQRRAACALASFQLGVQTVTPQHRVCVPGHAEVRLGGGGFQQLRTATHLAKAWRPGLASAICMAIRSSTPHLWGKKPSTPRGLCVKATGHIRNTFKEVSSRLWPVPPAYGLGCPASFRVRCRAEQWSRGRQRVGKSGSKPR